MDSATSITYPNHSNSSISGLVFCIAGAVLVFILIFVCCGYGCLKKRKLEAQIIREEKAQARAQRLEQFAMIKVPSNAYLAES
ncbi:hypothetical protein BGAL_0067g00080 [Botrytis galanthina]|uniref:Uncharacterized protein n=1 Tax=Botrytis galanthina TaxID=278940 RepID=A0A4S8R4L9_9HELO|nr:hypothetical protein BGAL_0067g00080 [Botrytis galanthina]